MEHHALASAARGPHFEELALALGQLLHDDAGEALVDVDDDLLDRLQLLAVRVHLVDDLRPRHRQLEAFAAHVLDEDAELQLAAPGNVEGVLVLRDRRP